MAGLHDQLMAAAGIKSQQMGEVMHGMKASFDLLCEIRSAVAFAFGRNSSKLVVPHDRANLPYIKVADITGVTNFPLKSVLNKSVTHGHIKNLGENAVLIRFQSVGNNTMSDQYELAAGDVLDTSSWSYDGIEIRPGAAGDSRICLLAQ